MCIVEITSFAAANGNVIAGILELNQQKAEAKYRTQQIINQGKEAENNAAMIRQEGIEKARREKLNAILNMNNIKTKAAASNLSLASESVMNMIDDEKIKGENNALSTLNNSENRSKKYINMANSYYQNASLNSLYVKKNYGKGLYTLGHNSAMQVVQALI